MSETLPPGHQPVTPDENYLVLPFFPPSTTGGPQKGARVNSPARSGKARTAILLWLLGVPIPLILLFFLIKGCVGG